MSTGIRAAVWFDPAELDSDQRALYDAITTGARTAGVQHFRLTDEDGRLHGPFGLMLDVPRVGMPLQQLGSALRFETELTDREREIAILTVARITDSAFERHAHNAVGAAVGLGVDELAALAAGDFAGRDDRETAVAELTVRLASTGVVRPADLETELPHRIVLELVTLTGYYRILAQMMGLFGVGAPADEGAEPEEPR
jgi:4-carboxymuconolactone decarboxylase